MQKYNTYIEVGAKSSEDDGSLSLISEEEHLGLAGIVRFEYIVISLCNVNHSVSNMLERHLLELVCVESIINVNQVKSWNGVGRIDFVRWILSNSFLRANL